MRTLGDIRELRAGIRWLIRLRMVAICGVLITVLVADLWLKMELYVGGLYSVALFLLLYNLAFYYLSQRIHTVLSIRVVANLQIFLDFFSLTMLLHFSGGLENPFIFYYVFHTIVSAILLTRVEAAAQTLLAIAMFSAVVYLEQTEGIRHWHLSAFPGGHIYDAPLYNAGVYIVLVSTLLLSLYMTISVSERSRRKNVELSTIREQLTLQELRVDDKELLNAEKLSSLGEMAAGIAHEINNPLTVVLVNLDLIIDDMAEESDDRKTLQVAREEVVRCRGIIEQLLTFARGEEGGRRVCDAREILRDSIALVRNYASLHRVRVEERIPDGEAPCRINSAKIKQVLVNVMMNAIQAMPDGGDLIVEVGQRASACVEFVVEDSGKGIPKMMLSRIFDPFFTTKKAGEGAGLGLSICHRLIESHNGVIHIESNETQGTRVTIRLPCGN